MLRVERHDEAAPAGHVDDGRQVAPEVVQEPSVPPALEVGHLDLGLVVVLLGVHREPLVEEERRVAVFGLRRKEGGECKIHQYDKILLLILIINVYLKRNLMTYHIFLFYYYFFYY